MQTYTHLAVGAAIGATLFPHDYVAQAGCIVGAASSDVAFALEYASDRIKGLKPFASRPWVIREIGEAAHSVPVLLFFVATVAMDQNSVPHDIASFLSALSVGWISHILIDMFTHGGDMSQHGKMLAATDVSYLWPLNKIDPMVRIQPRVWEYRYDHGVLWPLKPFEQLVLYSSIGYTLIR